MAMEPKGERVAIVLFNKRLFAHLQLTKRRFKQLLKLQVRLHGSQRRSSLATAPLGPRWPPAFKTLSYRGWHTHTSLSRQSCALFAQVSYKFLSNCSLSLRTSCHDGARIRLGAVLRQASGSMMFKGIVIANLARKPVFLVLAALVLYCFAAAGISSRC